MNEKVVFVRVTVGYLPRGRTIRDSKTLSRATKYEGVAHMLFSAQPVFVCVTCFVVSNDEKRLLARYQRRGGYGGLTPAFFAHILLAMIKHILFLKVKQYSLKI